MSGGVVFILLLIENRLARHIAGRKTPDISNRLYVGNNNAILIHTVFGEKKKLGKRLQIDMHSRRATRTLYKIIRLTT